MIGPTGSKTEGRKSRLVCFCRRFFREFNNGFVKELIDLKVKRIFLNFYLSEN